MKRNADFTQAVPTQFYDQTLTVYHDFQARSVSVIATLCRVIARKTKHIPGAKLAKRLDRKLLLHIRYALEKLSYQYTISYLENTLF